MTQPDLSVVVTAYGRAEGARRAVASIQAVADDHDVEVVVVDDGSEPAVAAALDELAGPAVRVVHQPNAGLAAARVRGALESRGRWFAVLDDDDEWLPAWSQLLALLERDEAGPARLGIVSGGARLVDPAGRHLRDEPPRKQGRLLSGAVVQYLAGCFAVRRDLYDAAGGYLPGLCSSHQTELFVRCCAVAEELGLDIAHVDAPVARIERRVDTDRALSDPRMLFDGTRWILARHADRFALDPQERSNWEAVAALNGLRVGDRSARRHAATAVRLRPAEWRNWARLVGMWSPLGSRRWGRSSDYASVGGSQSRPLAHAVSLRGGPNAVDTSDDELWFLPWRYRSNEPASADADGTPFWGDQHHNDVRYQDPVYRWAARLVRGGRGRVIDIGCGSGVKLVRHVAPHTQHWLGVDQSSAIDLAESAYPSGHWRRADLSLSSTWRELAEQPADLVICADVIEHLEDPFELLERLRSLLAPGGVLLLSTPDRGRLERVSRTGPPRNPRHIREWTADELELLVTAAGLRVRRTRHLLPRAYSPTIADARRTVGRAVRRMAVPDRRSSLAMLLESDADVPTGTG